MEKKMKKKVLFICNHNAGRSQIAEGLLNNLYGDRYEAFSAGLNPTDSVNPHTTAVLREIGIDISGKTPLPVSEYRNMRFDRVVISCDYNPKDHELPASEDITEKKFPDPYLFSGSDDDILKGFREVRDEIKEWTDKEFSGDNGMNNNNNIGNNNINIDDKNNDLNYNNNSDNVNNNINDKNNDLNYNNNSDNVNNNINDKSNDLNYNNNPENHKCRLITVTVFVPDDPLKPPFRSPDTGRSLSEVVRDISTMMKNQGFEIRYEERPEDENRTKSLLLINSRPIEDFVPLPDPSKYCGMACADCGGSRSDAPCSRIYENIPESVLRLAVKKAADFRD
ncbi:arsenate reductase/protein-tyrosine-phosphatase family protein [Methanoplanus endosymbiosus]|uniref:Phosphotyrosine protein phosphatase I domain-containing protein n=1 Tax=Methanoplanus endosymbiosus TaxID=33865 RepID=A0A9E7PR14_9EURY|nr:DUF2703 domain-containing protein [Methanoplanus endosymbiosus]UUX93782.1 hypothetical protein L6E24_06625 [Methanoplanus endosymbiosus]